MKTAILIDGGFFIRRYKFIRGFNKEDTPEIMAKNLVSYCFKHIQKINNYRNRYNLPSTELYRIFYYDVEPFDGDSHNPITNRPFSFKNTEHIDGLMTIKTMPKREMNGFDSKHENKNPDI